jgi:hypothetical protein
MQKVFLLLVGTSFLLTSTVFAEDCAFGSCECKGPNCDTEAPIQWNFDTTPSEDSSWTPDPTPPPPVDPNRRARRRAIKLGRKAMKGHHWDKAKTFYQEALALARTTGQRAEVERLLKELEKARVDAIFRGDSFTKEEKAKMRKAQRKREKRDAEIGKTVIKKHFASAEAALKAGKYSLAQVFYGYILDKQPNNRRAKKGRCNAITQQAKSYERDGRFTGAKGVLLYSQSKGYGCRKIKQQITRLERASKAALDVAEKDAPTIQVSRSKGKAGFSILGDAGGRTQELKDGTFKGNAAWTKKGGEIAFPLTQWVASTGEMVLGEESVVQFGTPSKVNELVFKFLSGIVRLNDSVIDAASQAAKKAKGEHDKALKKSSRYDVQVGPGATCSIRGTDYAISYRKRRYTFAVLSGSIEVTPKDSPKSYLLNAGEVISWQEDAPRTKGLLPVEQTTLNGKEMRRKFPIFR